MRNFTSNLILLWSAWNVTYSISQQIDKPWEMNIFQPFLFSRILLIFVWHMFVSWKSTNFVWDDSIQNHEYYKKDLKSGNIYLHKILGSLSLHRDSSVMIYTHVRSSALWFINKCKIGIIAFVASFKLWAFVSTILTVLEGTIIVF